MSNETFSYTYSAKENAEIQKIRNKYMTCPETDFNRLKMLDNKVQNSGKITSLSVGIIGLLFFGIGLCFGLGVFNQNMVCAIIFGIFGLLITIMAYPIYKYIYKKTYEKYVPQILALADKIQK